MRTLCRVLMALPLFSLSMNICLAQDTQLSSEHYSENTENFNQFKEAQFGDDFYLLVTFKQLPSKAELIQLEKQQIKLLEYHSNKTYLATLPADLNPSILKSLNITNIQEVQKDSKIDTRLLSKNYPEWAVEENGKVDVAIIFHEETEKLVLQNFLHQHNAITLEDKHRNGTTVVARVAEDQIEKIAASPLVAYIDIEQEPDQILNHETCVNQKVNLLNSSLPGGYNLRGAGVAVGVGDGGELGDHIDFGDRVLNEANGTYSSFGDHGDHVSGIIGGSGNLNPRHRGMAPECTLVTQKTSQITYNTEDYFNTYGMVLTNNSYGTSFNCTTNGSYNYSAQTLDNQLRAFPKVLHVFAAGNSGNGTCEPYPQGYRSVLRYYQSAKNVLTVGMAEETRVIAHSSSRGPVLDGRLKPEIIGIGRNVVSTSRDYNYSTKGGTSMASPSVTGTLALLVEKYRLENSGENPDGALLKAIACNTADDLGNPGPDFIHGFGLINGRRAAEVIEQNHFSTDEIVNGEMKVSAINVPNGTKQLKVMLYWPDKEAAIYPDKALVNNLDFTIITPDGQTINPWVLDPSATGVTNDAVRGVDDINNIEQITIDVPMSGAYTIIVEGYEVPVGPQQFYLTYDLIQEEVIVTHPFGGESFEPDDHEFISWDADITNTNTFKLEFSLDGGNTWLQIAPAVAADQRSYNWTVPQNYTPDALVRVSKNGTTISGMSSDVFHIMGKPSALVATPTCEASIILDWQASDYTVGYEVYMYNGVEMQIVGSTEETTYVVDQPMEIGTGYWFSVRSIGMDGNRSQRVTAIMAIPEDIDICPWDDNPLVEAVGASLIGRDETTLSLTDDETVSILVKNIGSNDLESFTMFYSVDGGVPVQETYTGFIPSGESLMIDFATGADLTLPGEHHVDVWVEILGNNTSYSDSLVGSLIGEQISNSAIFLPFKETFTTAASDIYSENKIGLNGCLKWDVETQDLGHVEIEQNAAMTFRPTTLTYGAPIGNEAILTLNMLHYEDMSERIDLGFDYKTGLEAVATNYEPLDNVVSVRGSDTDEWLELYKLGDHTPEWYPINKLDITSLLLEHGQTYSTSFQIKFTNDNNQYFSIMDLIVDIYEEPEIEISDHVTGFTASQFGDDVILKWTPFEGEQGFFEIQVIDNYNNENDFDIIGSITAESTTTEPFFYTFIDLEPGKRGKRHYRIKYTSRDGTITYSPVLSVLINDEVLEEVFPNPFVDRFQLNYEASKDATIQVMVTDHNGRVVLQNPVEVSSGEQLIPIHLEESLPSGMYLLKVIDGAKTICHKVIKQ